MQYDEVNENSAMLTFLGSRSVAAATLSILALVSVSGCANVQETIPGESYTKANSSLAIETWEATATLAMVSVPNCGGHKLINTEVVSVSEPLRVSGNRATQGEWIERWTYDMCGTIVPVRVEYTVDELGTGYTASVEV